MDILKSHRKTFNQIKTHTGEQVIDDSYKRKTIM